VIRANKASRAFQKRTIRPLYSWHSAVPYACFLDTTAVASTILYPGQVAVKTTGEQMDFARADGAISFGLFNNFINGDMDELSGGTEISVWVGGRDSVFEVLAGPSSTETPLDPAITWTASNATRGGVALFPNAAGRLTTTAGTEKRVARLIEAVSNTKIVIQLDLATA
jgi:hypothetical protein